LGGDDLERKVCSIEAGFAPVAHLSSRRHLAAAVSNELGMGISSLRSYKKGVEGAGAAPP
jgi:hypothetical protein